jgi:hypothetical protein
MIRDGSGHRRIPCAGERIEEVCSADALILIRNLARKSATSWARVLCCASDKDRCWIGNAHRRAIASRLDELLARLSLAHALHSRPDLR